MKIKQIFVLFLFLYSNSLQAQWKENFDNNSWKEKWRGDDSFFHVNKEGQLQTALNPQAAIVSISRNSLSGVNQAWSFTVKLNFKLATNNFLRVYLMSDQSNLAFDLQGYFFEIAGTGKEYTYALKRQNGIRSKNLVVSDSMVTPPSIDVKVRVELDEYHQWRLRVKEPSNAQFRDIGDVKDSLFTKKSPYFGLYCRYTTKARSNQFYFDNFEVKYLHPDTIAPVIRQCKAIAPNQILLVFSEKMDSLTLQHLQNFRLNQQYPISIQSVALDTVRLYFSDTLQTGNYKLVIHGLKDRSGNMMSNFVQSFFHIKPYLAKRGDIHINEIMAIPKSYGRLPNAEYVELWNTSDEYLILNGWTLADKTRKVQIPIDTLVPNSYALLCHQNFKQEFQVFGKVIALPTFPNLNNDTDQIILSNESGETIDAVTYDESFYDDRQKQKGSFSLEWIGRELCDVSLEWTGSKAALGCTPGKANSVLGLKKPTLKVNAFKMIDETAFFVELNQRIHLDELQFGISSHENKFTKQVKFVDSLTQITFRTDQPIVRGEKLTAFLGNINNCDERILKLSFPVFVAYIPDYRELLISEIMIYPRSGGSPYIEIYNPSLKIFNLKDLLIANRNSDGNPVSLHRLSLEDIWIQPEDYFVICTDSLNILANYQVRNPDFLYQMGSLPRFSSERGTVWLLNARMQTVDEFTYSIQMHMETLKDTRGVALERVSFIKAADALGNFVSVSGSMGYGTPTYQNSSTEIKRHSNVFHLGSKTFSPDGDGFEDYLEIHYDLNAHNWMAEMKMFDINGNFVQSIFTLKSIGNKGVWTWHPNGYFSNRWPQGIYVLWIQIFNSEGQRQIFKLPFALIRK